MPITMYHLDVVGGPVLKILLLFTILSGCDKEERIFEETELGKAREFHRYCLKEKDTVRIKVKDNTIIITC